MSPFADGRRGSRVGRLALTNYAASACRSMDPWRRFCFPDRHDPANTLSRRRDRRRNDDLSHRLCPGDTRRIARIRSRDRHREHSVIDDHDDHARTEFAAPAYSGVAASVGRGVTDTSDGRLVRRRQIRLGRQYAEGGVRLFRLYEIRIRKVWNHVAADVAGASARRPCGRGGFWLVAPW